MRFVYYQGRRQFSLAAVNDIIGNLKQQFTLVPACDGEPQITGEVLQELHGGETAVEDVSVADIFTLLQQVEQVVEQKSLSSSHFSGQDHNSLVSPDAVVEGCQSFVVSLGWKQKRRIGSDLKRIALQVVKGFVHGGSLTVQITDC